MESFPVAKAALICEAKFDVVMPIHKVMLSQLECRGTLFLPFYLIFQ